ncbi:DUF6533 domain-containing protein [Sporobolomyces koalae]|uniref:DUF6533 domain-containing protein n=1 Tax=Sporobolomyces koalae TaxID=500713 RepID=UPI003180AC20
MDLDELKGKTTAELQYLVAWTAILAWDWLATLPSEVKYIWFAKRWTPLRVVFLLNRYGTLVIQVIALVMIVATVPAGAQMRPVELPAPVSEYIGLTGCITGVYVGSHPDFVYVLSIAPFIVNLVLLVSTVYKSHRIAKEIGCQVPVLQRCVKDGVQYFCAITLFHVIEVVFWSQPDEAIKSFNIPALIVISSTLSCRLALSLHVNAPGSSALSSLPYVKTSAPAIPPARPQAPMAVLLHRSEDHDYEKGETVEKLEQEQA